MYGKIRVRIKGLTPLLMHRCDPEGLKAKSRKTTKVYDDEKEARKAAYIAVIDGEEQLYIPFEALYKMMIVTARRYKSKGTSLSSILAGSIMVEPEKVPLGRNDYEIDVRDVVVQRARVRRARPKLSDWEASFTLVYDKEMIGDAAILETILKDGGKRIGILDYRPQKGGWFGKFMVKKFEVEAEKVE